MKGYENFPAHWETMSIKRIFYCVSGNGFKIELQGKLQGDYPFCKVSDLNGEERDIRKAKFYVDVQTVMQEKFNVVPECSILFAKIGEALKKNHRKINLVPCCIDNNCAALVVRNNNFSVKYGYYVMKCIDMACFDNGGTIPYVDMKQLMIYKIPVPPKDEQDQIARFLDWKITAIDKLIAIRREELRNLAELKKALITREVTRGNWERVRLKRVCDVTLGKMVAPYPSSDADTLEEYVCAKDVHFDGVNLDNLKKMWFRPNEKEQYRIYDGDLLVVEGGSVGNCAIVTNLRGRSVYVQNLIHIIRPKDDKVIMPYVCYCLQYLCNTGYMKTVSNVATIAHYTKQKVLATPIRYDKYVQSYTKFIQFILWHSRDMPSCFIEPDFADVAGYFRLV